MNSSSPYYRVLCFHKIMEGLLGPLRTSIKRRARAIDFELGLRKDIVPDHPDFPAGLRKFAGTPLKVFYDSFLSSEYRNAMAHFNLKQKSALDASSPTDASRYTDVAFVSDLCVRTLIHNHEKALADLVEAESI